MTKSIFFILILGSSVLAGEPSYISGLSVIITRLERVGARVGAAMEGAEPRDPQARLPIIRAKGNEWGDSFSRNVAILNMKLMIAEMMYVGLLNNGQKNEFSAQLGKWLFFQRVLYVERDETIFHELNKGLNLVENIVGPAVVEDSCILL